MRSVSLPGANTLDILFYSLYFSREPVDGKGKDQGSHMKTNVYIVKCGSYEKAEEKIEELFALMGGIGQFAKKGEKITLKANLLGALAPETAVGTHPAIVAAVGRMAKKEGAIPLIADSPGSGYRYTEAALKRVYTACRMYDAAEKAGIDLNMDTGYEKVSFPQGKLIKHMEVIRPISQADGVINLCKMKTHMFMHMSGAVKNLYGIIPGLSKVGYHAKLRNKDRFAEMLLDLALYVSPRLSVMDAVLAMEGEGPGATGTPRQVGLLLASTSPLALDVAAGEIMGLPRDQNPVLVAAEKRGLTPCRIEDINVMGEEIPGLKIPDYVLPSTVKSPGSKTGNSSLVKRYLPLLIKQYPVVLNENCIGCGICADSCPKKTIALVTQQGKKKALINTKNCIRCFCCHELCPYKAIEVK